MQTSKITCYTSITNQKDEDRNDILCFSKNLKFISPVMGAKIYKVLAHKFLECDISIWMDGNIHLLKSAQWYVDNWLGENDIAFFRHYKSKDLAWELKWIKYVWRSRDRRVYNEAVAQVKHYEALGLPANSDMAMGGFIIRRHNKAVAQFNEAWWAEICRWGQRDQLSLPMVLKSMPWLKVNRIVEILERDRISQSFTIEWYK